MNLNASELAARLGKGYEPSPEQAAVIEADPGRSHLVVAGAGSGKTETMSDRVSWLVASGYTSAERILGLTFTRKAAAELGERIRGHLTVLEGPTLGALEQELPEVSTYNAFAGALYRDHALRIGREPDAIIISEATAWQLAWDVVAGASAVELDEAGLSMRQVTAAVLRLAHAMSDHSADPARVAEIGRDAAALLGPLAAVETVKSRKGPLSDYATRLGLLPVLSELAGQFQAAKRARGFIEFSDQVFLAREIIQRHPDVAEGYRARFSAVLLDEYQDTSVLQTRFFAELFAGTPVMAVGDPDQSIYGFRGASAANLLSFGSDFSSDSVFSLSVSWRNPQRVLTAANTIAGPLHAGLSFSKPDLRPKPGAPVGGVTLAFPLTIDREAAELAEWMRQALSAAPTASAAVLFRAKRLIPLYATALRDAGLRVHVSGVSGVLDEPVVTDVVSALRAIYDPGANSDLIRLLSGARWQIGARDIATLHRLGEQLLQHDEKHRPLPGALRQSQRDSLETAETVSLADALDSLLDRSLPVHWLEDFSAEALPRLRAAGAELRSLRRRVGLPLGDLVTLVTHSLQLDIEAHANESALFAESALERFLELISGFASVSDSVSLGAFLDWLELVESEEDVSPASEAPEPGTVQLLTIHAAKGLEWDLVAIPRWTDTELPKRSPDNSAWLALGHLPWSERGDAAHIPQLHIAGESPIEAFERIEAFKASVRDHYALEERRIAYVALTRAKAELWLSGSYFSGGETARTPSPLLLEIAAALELDGALQPPRELDGYTPTEPPPPLWPRDPFGERRSTVEAAAAAVETAEPSEALSEQLERSIALLLAERAAQQGGDTAAGELVIPLRIPASRVKDYLENPRRVLRELARPLPQKPFAATRLGTLFHEWVELRSIGSYRETLDLDALEPTALGGDEAVPIANDLAALQAVFEASPWGNWQPLEVEREIHLPLAGSVFICKIDAVYRVDEHSPVDPGRPAGTRFQIVDWKTGAAPRDAEDLELKQSQLALYRLAYARRLSVPVEQIDAVFYFVSENAVIRPERLYDEAEFASRWGKLSGSVET